MGTLEEAAAITRIILRAGVRRGPGGLDECLHRPVEGCELADAIGTV